MEVRSLDATTAITSSASSILTSLLGLISRMWHSCGSCHIGNDKKLSPYYVSNHPHFYGLL